MFTIYKPWIEKVWYSLKICCTAGNCCTYTLTLAVYINIESYVKIKIKALNFKFEFEKKIQNLNVYFPWTLCFNCIRQGPQHQEERNKKSLRDP